MTDPWEKAAACEEHARTTKDEKLREKFRKLRDSWIRIANDAELKPKDGAPPIGLGETT